jgi:hypothetical protein
MLFTNPVVSMISRSQEALGVKPRTVIHGIIFVPLTPSLAWADPNCVWSLNDAHSVLSISV